MAAEVREDFTGSQALRTPFFGRNEALYQGGASGFDGHVKPRSDHAPDTAANPLVTRIVGFLREVGFEVEFGTIDGSTFLPGITVSAGRLRVDPARLTWPGDLLHEAGHLAVLDPACIDQGVSDDPGEEMAAIAWSFAAVRHLDIDPAVLFHAGGYRGGSKTLVENFTLGSYVGVPMLAWWGLSIEPHRATPGGPAAYPHMLAWRRMR